MQTGQYLTMWLDAYVTPIKAPSTISGYRRAIAHLPESILEADIASLSGLELQAVINRQAAVYPRAAQLTYTVLHVALARSVLLRLLPYSPMDGVDKPRHKPRKAQILTVDQLGAYLSGAHASPLYPLLMLMATCGLRRGEALGLTWAQVDVDRQLLTVCQQRQRITGQGLQLRTLKSDSSHRVLPLATPLCAELTSWRRGQMIRGAGGWGWVVDTTPETLAAEHWRVIDGAGLPHVTLHGLRHSLATAMASTGTPIKVLQGILGHSHYQLTADLYADHLRPDIYAADLTRLAHMVL